MKLEILLSVLVGIAPMAWSMKKDAETAPCAWIGVSYFTTVDPVNKERDPKEGLELHKITSPEDFKKIKEKIIGAIKAKRSREIYIDYDKECKGLNQFVCLLGVVILKKIGTISILIKEC